MLKRARYINTLGSDQDMKIIKDLKGVIFAADITTPTEYGDMARPVSDCFWFIDNRLHKFKNDEILMVKGDKIVFLDGHVDNKAEICSMHNGLIWEDAFISEFEEHNTSRLRGGFTGFTYSNGSYRLFSDHVGNRALYYYAEKNKVVISTKLFFITDVLKKNGIRLNVDEQAVRYLISLGFIPDDSTICSNIKRVCPGDYVDINDTGKVSITNYYRPDNTNINSNMTVSDAIDGLDYFFRQAISREYEKDVEYGYRHLVDLSGGLDSRMVSWVAHEMGYEDQINITFCKKDYIDLKIAQEISLDLRHKFIYMPLDDFKWFEDYEINTAMLNASVPYAAATGTRHILDIVKGLNCGIEHTGMVGDAIIGTFYKDKSYNYSEPTGDENAYSTLLKYKVPQDVLNRFANREQYSIYTRGLLCAQSSYMLRQNYFENSSPFLDVDFLDFILSVPFEHRANHKLYLKWILAKYPKAAEYGWEKWHGARPTERSRKFEKKLYQLGYSMDDMITKLLKGNSEVGMNPIDYWFTMYADTAASTNNFFEDCWESIEGILTEGLGKDMYNMYYNGNAGEKMQVITACAGMLLLRV